MVLKSRGLEPREVPVFLHIIASLSQMKVTPKKLKSCKKPHRSQVARPFNGVMKIYAEA